MKDDVQNSLPGAVCIQKGELAVWVAPQRGMNVERIVYRGIDIIHCDAARASQNATYAVPILYPTPNRVKNEHFTFEGKTIPAKMHGFARNACFEWDSFPQNNQIVGRLENTPDTDFFEQFPYRSVLTVSVTVSQNGIEWRYRVENKDEKNLAYGLAIHPFFIRYPHTCYQVFSDSCMEMNENKIPTGRYLPLNGKYAVNEIRSVDRYQLDDVFCVAAAPMAKISYPSQNIEMQFCASDEFKKCVVFTPKQQTWFCIEPQTSSTDCHNLHARNFVEQANLQIVAPGEGKSGWIKLQFCK